MTTDNGRLSIEDFKSQRTVIGVKLDGSITETIGWRAGLAWEHEFKGEGSSSLDGVALADRDFGGDAAAFDLGANMTLGVWDLSVGARTRFGDREGVIGNVKAIYKF